MKYDNFINGILDDYTYCREHDTFISCKDIVEIDLEEAFWDDKYGNKWRHYQKHVCAEGEKFTGVPSDNFKRIKFPHMPFGKYLGNAERLADTTPVLSEVSDGRVFGWKTTVGWLKDDVCVKFKKTDLRTPDGQELYEYVAYTIINGKPVVREINGVNFTYYEIVDRRVFSYGLSLHPTTDFKKVDTLSPLELEEALVEKRVYKLTPELLTEANRQYLLQKSRKGRDYAPSNQYKGRNRFERRTKSSISATVKDYNMIQMDPLFKRDILEFKIPVLGETDVYTVDVRVDGLLSEIRKQLMNNKGELEFKVVLQSLMRVLNMGDVYIGCNCPDARYRQAYYQTKNNYKAGYKERRPSDKTNPNDDLGAGCKHVLLILANLDWCVKVASVINNYIKYCKEHLQKNYADYIFPKIYGVKYDKAVQLQLFDNGLFPEDQKTMQDVIGQGFRGKDDKGKFVKGNEFRFQPKPKEEPGQEDENPLDLKFNPNEPEEVAEESLQEDVSVGNDLEDNSILELDVGKSIFQPSHIKGVFRISNYSSFEDLCNKYNISLYREDLEDSGFNFNKNSFILKYFKSKIYSLNSIFEQISLNDDAGVVIDIISDRGVPSPGFVKLQKSEFENFKDELGITEIIDQHYRYNDLEEDITVNNLTLDPEECRSYLVNYIASKIGNCVVKDNAIFYIDEDFCIYEGDDDRDVEKGIFFIINVTPDTIDICFPNYATSIEWEHINDYPLKHFLAGCEYVKSCYTFRAFVECIDNYMGRGWFGIDSEGNDFWDNNEDTAENSNEDNIYDYLKAYNLYC